MKIPYTFIPDKNVDKKINELVGCEESVELTIEELLKDNMKIILENVPGVYSKLLEYVMDKIVSDTFEGKIKWKEDSQYYPNTLESYKAKATIINYGEKK